MSQHTPGPWIFDRDAYEIQAESIWMGQTETRIVADLNCGTLAVMDVAESDANARLIAAAPELLAALRATLDALTTLTLPGHAAIEINDARAAIAKATGDATHA